jgi:DNA-binding LacI/PurR family transcriptional regulator
LIEEKFPFVLIGRPLDKNLREIDPVIWVNNDNVQLGMLATEHLIQQGCKKIAMINGPVDMVVSHDRRKGYLKALEIYGLAVNEDFIINVPFTEEGGAEAIDKMLSSGRVPDGIFAADDILALGAIEKLKDKGFSIPQNIAIVGVNNSVISRLVKPALTTVKIPIFDFGVQAALMLIESISCQGKEQFKPRHMIFPTELVVRESSIKG